MEQKIRTDAKILVEELTDLVRQLSEGKRTPKEASRWYSGIEKRLQDILGRCEGVTDEEITAYMTRATNLSLKANRFIQKKLNRSSNDVRDISGSQKSYQPLGHLLMVEKQLSLCKGLGFVVKSTSVEKIGKLVLKLFQENGQELRLMRACIEAELLAATTSQGTMFRRNSINSVCLAAFARSVGGDYLKSCLSGTMERLSTGTEEYEIDPAKIAGGTQVPVKNLMNVVARIEELLNSLKTSLESMPESLGFVCSVLASTVSKVMPEARNTAVGGFLMLRYICPALASPQNAGLTPPPPERRRGLILLSKCVINLSNDVAFGKKEEFMAPLENLLVGARVKLHEFYDAIVRKFPDTLDLKVKIPTHSALLKLDDEAIKNFHRFLEEPKVLEEFDEVILKHSHLGLDQHTPGKLRQALSRCPDLPARRSGASSAASTPTLQVPARKSPNHSPGHSPNQSPASSPGIHRKAARSAQDLRAPPPVQRRHNSTGRSKSSGKMGADDDVGPKPRGLRGSGSDRSAPKSPKSSPRLMELFKTQNKSESVETEFSTETYNPNH